MEALAALPAAGRAAGPACCTSCRRSPGPDAVQAGFDRIVLTGSAETGARVLAAAAPLLTPATMELSGVGRGVRAAGGRPRPGCRQPGPMGCGSIAGATCIAPRRVFVPQDQGGGAGSQAAGFAAGVAADPGVRPASPN